MNIGFLLSGSGSTLQNFIDWEKNSKLKGHIRVVISSKSDAYGLQRAKKNNIPHFVVEYNNFRNRIQEYSEKITSILNEYKCDLILMGGFLSLYQIPDIYNNKVLNIHPSLIPAFCGKGMYGKKVHQTVIDYGVKVSGCTVHFVNNHYDNGPIIEQQVVTVSHDDTAESLAKKVGVKERELYPVVVNNFIEGKYTIKGRQVVKLK